MYCRRVTRRSVSAAFSEAICSIRALRCVTLPRLSQPEAASTAVSNSTEPKPIASLRVMPMSANQFFIRLFS